MYGNAARPGSSASYPSTLEIAVAGTLKEFVDDGHTSAVRYNLVCWGSNLEFSTYFCAKEFSFKKGLFPNRPYLRACLAKGTAWPS